MKKSVQGLTDGIRSNNGAEKEGRVNRQDGDGGGRKEGEDCGAEDG